MPLRKADCKTMLETTSSNHSSLHCGINLRRDAIVLNLDILFLVSCFLGKLNKIKRKYLTVEVEEINPLT